MFTSACLRMGRLFYDSQHNSITNKGLSQIATFQHYRGHDIVHEHCSLLQMRKIDLYASNLENIVPTSSSTWRNDLKNRCKKLNNMIGQERWTEKDGFILEQVVCLGFYGIRRLEVCGLLNPKRLKGMVDLKEFPHRPGGPLYPGLYPLEESYSLSEGCSLRRNCKFLIHQLSHSYLFEVKLNKAGRPTAVYFTSDHLKKKSLFLAEVKVFIETFDNLSVLDGLEP